MCVDEWGVCRQGREPIAEEVRLGHDDEGKKDEGERVDKTRIQRLVYWKSFYVRSLCDGVVA